MRLRRPPVCAVALLAASLLGPIGSAARAAASPTPAPSTSAAKLAFVAPAGWKHLQGTSDGLGSWQGPGDSDYYQNIVLDVKPGFASLDALLQAEVHYIASLPDQFGYAPTNTTLCGNHPGMYLSYTYTSSTGLPVTAEEMIAVFGTTGYRLRYSKSIEQEANVAAEKSLTTLCGRT
jgi:hypothetical protein